MNKLKQLLAGCVAVGMAIATPVKANEIEEHQRLWDTLEMVGVNVVINHPEDCNGRIDGVYDSIRGYITICQDQGTEAFKMVGWTDNDLDTLRHEAQHVVQDCVGNRIGDGYLSPLFDDSKQRNDFVIKAIGVAEAKRIVVNYRSRGAEVVNNELEAFAVASSVSATQIADKLLTVCASR